MSPLQQQSSNISSTSITDNFNTHTLASLYATSEAPKAYELAQKFEIHDTPKHGSWLNRAAIEIAAVAKTCLAKRSYNVDTFRREIQTNVSERNKNSKPVQWRFSVQKARCKLKSLYPKFGVWGTTSSAEIVIFSI